MKALFNLIPFLLLPLLIKGQDPVFTQVYSVPMYYNPAFAGSIDKARLAFNFRNQFPGVSLAPITFSASYDQYSQRLNGGIGGMAFMDQAGVLRKYYAAGIYSRQFFVKGKWALSPAIKAGIQISNIRWDKLVVLDSTPDPVFEAFPYFQPELGTGFLANTRKFFIGLAADHLIPGHVPLRVVFQTGYTFSKHEKSDLSFSPIFLFMAQGPMRAFWMLTGSLRYKFLYIGTGYLSNQNFPLQIGLELKGFRLGYSYLLDFSPVSVYSFEAHEVSLRYQFKVQNRNARPSAPGKVHN